MTNVRSRALTISPAGHEASKKSGYNGALGVAVISMNDDFFEKQAARVRAIADRADPFTKKRLLDLAEKYDVRAGKPSRATRNISLPNPLASSAAEGQKQSDNRAPEAPRDLSSR
jgi:hypothetical protein